MADPLKTPAEKLAQAALPAGTPVSAATRMPYATYAAPYGIDRGTCDRRALAHRIDAAGGPLIGSRIGLSMDQIDQACVARILEFAPDRAAIRWYGASKLDYGGAAFAVTPLRTYERDGRFCRDYQATATIAGQDEQGFGTACRMTDGVWRVAG
jgi:surface antigen